MIDVYARAICAILEVHLIRDLNDLKYFINISFQMSRLNMSKKT